MHPDKHPETVSLGRSTTRRSVKITFGVIGLLILAIIGLVAFKGISVASKVFVGNTGDRAPFLKGLVDPNKLRGEGDGRINILLIGIGGVGHPGGQLADSIEVASIDPVNKTLALLSLPRDLYVEIPGNGWSKINAAHAYGEEKRTGGGPDLLKQVVARVLDLPIHYYARVDFTAFKKIVDTIGGVNVCLDKPLNDPLYPDAKMQGYDPFSLSAGCHILAGDIALKYARSRETSSDFDRSKRQQQLMIAIKEKTFTLNVLSNPRKVNEIINALGSHVRTDLTFAETERLVGMAGDFQSASVITKVLDTAAGGPLVGTSTPETGYIINPRLGQGNYKELQRIAHEIFTDPYLAKEDATIEVQNGSKTAGAALDLADYLKSYGYNIQSVKKSTTPVAKTIIYDYSKGAKALTLKFLQQRLHSTVITGKPGQSTANFVIVVGDDYVPGVLDRTKGQTE